MIWPGAREGVTAPSRQTEFFRTAQRLSYDVEVMTDASGRAMLCATSPDGLVRVLGHLEGEPAGSRVIVAGVPTGYGEPLPATDTLERWAQGLGGDHPPEGDLPAARTAWELDVEVGRLVGEALLAGSRCQALRQALPALPASLRAGLKEETDRLAGLGDDVSAPQRLEAAGELVRLLRHALGYGLPELVRLQVAAVVADHEIETGDRRPTVVERGVRAVRGRRGGPEVVDRLLDAARRLLQVAGQLDAGDQGARGEGSPLGRFVEGAWRLGYATTVSEGPAGLVVSAESADGATRVAVDVDGFNAGIALPDRGASPDAEDVWKLDLEVADLETRLGEAIRAADEGHAATTLPRSLALPLRTVQESAFRMSQVWSPKDTLMQYFGSHRRVRKVLASQASEELRLLLGRALTYELPPDLRFETEQARVFAAPLTETALRAAGKAMSPIVGGGVPGRGALTEYTVPWMCRWANRLADHAEASGPG
jgi:hypothetical protein